MWRPRRGEKMSAAGMMGTFTASKAASEAQVFVAWGGEAVFVWPVRPVGDLRSARHSR
jgi:hypothetical protein